MQRIKRDVATASTEKAEFPITCEECLGDNPYLKVTRQALGGECRLCTRPFDIFRWARRPGERQRTTAICQTCAKSRFLCQSCLLDLQFRVPAEVRDTIIGKRSTAPTSAVNREYFAKKLESMGASMPLGDVNYETATAQEKENLRRLARESDIYKAVNISENNREALSHHTEAEPQLKQNVSIQDRSREDDPREADSDEPQVKRRVIRQSELVPPEDDTVVTLCVTGLPESAKEDQVKAAFEDAGVAPESIKSMTVMNRLAFVNFVSRDAAERGARRVSRGIYIDNVEAGVKWGRSRKDKSAGK